MFSLLSRTMRTATRLDTWGAPDHWHDQQADYRTRCCREDAERARLRRGPSGTGPRQDIL